MGSYSQTFSKTPNMKLSKYEIGLIAVAAVVLLYLYSKGTFKGAGEKGLNIDPNTDNTDGSTATADAQDPKYKNEARNFRTSLLDNSTDAAIFQNACYKLLQLSDADLKSVSNAYNTIFVNQEYNTMRALLVQEWVNYWWTQSTSYEGTSQYYKDELLKRFSKLGI